MPPLALSTIDPNDLRTLLAGLGQPAWRAEQLQRAVWQPAIRSLNDVRQLPGRLRRDLDPVLRFTTAEAAAVTRTDDGMTLKLLTRLDDGQTVETVAMESPASDRRRRRATVCISSQVGCAVGCPFCATGQMGLRRSCSAAEMVDQVRVAAWALRDAGLGPVTHVVYMGMGEPLAAYASTIESLRVLQGPGGVSARRLTVSTSGVVPAIVRLAGEGIPATLAVSLHAATDELRDRLVPLNRRYPIAALMEAATGYGARTGRRLSLEWCLIEGVNDDAEQAEGLRRLAFAARAHVNVIPMNPVAGSPWGAPDRRSIDAFMARLGGVRATVRDTRGFLIDAACGQLRAGLEQRRAIRADGTLGAALRPSIRVPSEPVSAVQQREYPPAAG